MAYRYDNSNLGKIKIWPGCKVVIFQTNASMPWVYSNLNGKTMNIGADEAIYFFAPNSASGAADIEIIGDNTRNIHYVDVLNATSWLKSSSVYPTLGIGAQIIYPE